MNLSLKSSSTVSSIDERDNMCIDSMERKTPNKPISERTYEEIRNRARELHADRWVIEIAEDAPVTVYGDEMASIPATIYIARRG